jgi:adenylate cyclase
MGIGFAVVLLLGAGLAVNFLGRWKLRVSDVLFLPRPVSSQIVLINIDDASIQEIGQWPWKRSVHARLLDKLGDRPKVIGLDVSFPEVSTVDEDIKLANAIERSGRVVLPITTSKLAQMPDKVRLVEFLSPAKVFSEVTVSGVVNKHTDSDGVVRQTPIEMVDTEGKIINNFSVEILSMYLDKPAAAINKSIPTVDGYMRINYASGPRSFDNVSYKDVLSGAVPASEFAGKIILIGATALDLHDNQITPVSDRIAMDGVEIHANTVQTILEGKFLRLESKLESFVWMAALVMVLAVLLMNMRIVLGIAALVVGVCGYMGFVFWRFDQGVIMNLLYPPLGMIIVYVVVLGYKYLFESRQKQFIRKALGYYLSEPVMREVLNDPKRLSLGGQRKEISVLFSDIAGFTSISEKIPAETLAILLNKYLTRMTRVVFKYNGVLDKYIGDAVMAFWGAPIEDENHPYLACETALEMQKEILNVKKDWSEHLDVDFSVRVGINTGEAVVGNMGSDMRFDYSLLGDTVNLGSRLEGINKEYGTLVIISGSTYEKVKERVVARLIDTVAVKGKEKGVPIYELMSLGSADFAQAELIREFEEARGMYHEGEFKSALKKFNLLANKYPNDGPIKTYIHRCEELSRHAPEHWDGVYHAKSK